MEIKISKAIADKVGFTQFVQFGATKDSWNYRTGIDLDLTTLSDDKLKKLTAVLEPFAKKGAGIVLKDISMYVAAVTGGAKGTRATSVKGFGELLKAYLKDVDGHRVFQRAENEEKQMWLCYYVSEIKYYPTVKKRDYYHPEHITMTYMNLEFDGAESHNVNFYKGDSVNLTAAEALVAKGYYPETEELRFQYKDSIAFFEDVVKNVGKQYLAIGYASTDVDGNEGGKGYRSSSIRMIREGEPTKVVGDIFFEDNDSRRNNKASTEIGAFWDTVGIRKAKPDADEFDEDDVEEDDEAESVSSVEIPIHPYVAIFDLKKHLRLKIHVDYLTAYKYDQDLAEKLILPAEEKDLVSMLVEHKDGGFTDVVKGKGGGAIVLLAGPPGTGKTLTAEIYAESEQRALYSVQCSQLGMNAEELEAALGKVLSRANRWKAVMLLDEADVYVHQRGNDIQQNAIVGVFLRVLEYQSAVLFLTTNRPDDVDDAIASRCVARVTYGIPTRVNQGKIWQVLAGGAGIKLTPETIAKLVVENSECSGRDIKNLLKLGAMYAKWTKKPFDAETIAFVKKFKPTRAQTEQANG